MAGRLSGLTAMEQPLAPLGGFSAVAPPPPLFGGDRALLWVAVALGVLATGWKLALAATGNVIWDEAHFAVLGQHLDWGYTDIPPGWPLLARLCTSMLGWSPLAVRTGGLVVSQCIPLGVYYLSTPLVSRREAIWAALLSMLIPAFGGSGIIFYPECAVQLLFTLMLGSMLRALRSDALIWWALTGTCAALGLLVHFRFVMAASGVSLFLIASAAGRRRLRQPGLYLAALIAAAGALPGLIYNVREHWPSLAYHLVNRQKPAHDIRLSLLLLLEQAALLTPVAFLGLLESARTAVKSALGGSESGFLTASVGLAILGFYLAISPFTRDLNAYWLFLGYLPFLPGLPRTLADFVASAFTARGQWMRSAAIASIPVLALSAALVGTGFDLAWTRPMAIDPRLRPYLFSRLEDWRQIEPALRRARLEAMRRFGPPDPVIVASGHVPALRLEFPGKAGRKVYGLDEPDDELTRFAVLRRAWGLDEVGLSRNHPGQGAILVLPEPTYLYTTPAEVQFRRRVCAEFSELRLMQLVELPPGRTALEIYTGRVQARPGVLQPLPPCPLFDGLRLAHPLRAQLIDADHQSNQAGVAADQRGIRNVDVILDGRLAAHGRYGLDPRGGRVSDVLNFDPNYPRLQFDFQFPRSMLTPGAHRVWLRASRGDGSVIEGGARTFYVR